MTKIEQQLEQTIIGKLIVELIENSYNIEIERAYGYTWIYAWGTEKRPSKSFNHWIKLCEGNGADLISDYTVSLEKIVSEVEKFNDQYRD